MMNFLLVAWLQIVVTGFDIRHTYFNDLTIFKRLVLTFSGTHFGRQNILERLPKHALVTSVVLVIFVYITSFVVMNSPFS